MCQLSQASPHEPTNFTLMLTHQPAKAALAHHLDCLILPTFTASFTPLTLEQAFSMPVPRCPTRHLPFSPATPHPFAQVLLNVHAWGNVPQLPVPALHPPSTDLRK